MTAPGVTVVLRALGLGDLLTGFPAIRGVRRARPHDLLILLTTPGVAPLAEAARIADAVVAVGELEPLPVHGPVDLAVNLHGRGPASHRLLEAIGPRRLIGYELPDGPRWPESLHEVERWCRLVDGLRPDGQSVDRDALDLEVPGCCPSVDEQLTLVHPGASAPARCWPAERWAGVVRFELGRGHRVLVTGGDRDRELVRTVVSCAGLSAEADLSGRTTVLDLVELVARAGRVVSGDTGVAHLATALRRPSVVLFGPSDPRVWGPPPDRPDHHVLWAGRTGDPNGDRLDAGLAQITVDQVCRVLEEMEGGGRPRATPATEALRVDREPRGPTGREVPAGPGRLPGG